MEAITNSGGASRQTGAFANGVGPSPFSKVLITLPRQVLPAPAPLDGDQQIELRGTKRQIRLIG